MVPPVAAATVRLSNCGSTGPELLPARPHLQRDLWHRHVQAAYRRHAAAIHACNGQTEIRLTKCRSPAPQNSSRRDRLDPFRYGNEADLSERGIAGLEIRDAEIGHEGAAHAELRHDGPCDVDLCDGELVPLRVALHGLVHPVEHGSSQLRDREIAVLVLEHLDLGVASAKRLQWYGTRAIDIEDEDSLIGRGRRGWRRGNHHLSVTPLWTGRTRSAWLSLSALLAGRTGRTLQTRKSLISSLAFVTFSAPESPSASASRRRPPAAQDRRRSHRRYERCWSGWPRRRGRRWDRCCRHVRRRALVPGDHHRQQRETDHAHVDSSRGIDERQATVRAAIQSSIWAEYARRRENGTRVMT